MSVLDDGPSVDGAVAWRDRHQPVAPYRGAQIQVSRKHGVRPGVAAARANVGPIRAELPVTKSGIRAGLARLRG